MRPHDQTLTISTNTSGDNTLVAAVADRSTKVYGLRLSVAGAVIVQVKRGSTVLETFNFAAAGVMPPLILREEPYYRTGVNEALVLNLSGAVQVNGALEYGVS